MDNENKFISTPSFSFFILSFMFINLFLLSACENNKLNRFKSNLYERWFSAKKIKIFRREYFDNQLMLSRPANTTQLIFAITTEKDYKDCFYYKIPGKKEKGVMAIHEVKAFIKCPSLPPKNAKWLLKNVIINKLSLSHKENSLSLKFAQGYSEEFIKIIFFNINLNSKKISYKKYSSSANPMRRRGPTVWKKSKNILKLRKINPYKNIATFFYQIGPCHDFNDECEEIIKNSCRECPFGYFKVVGRNCPGGETKYCGPNKCGEKGWPACVRGKQYEKGLALDFCQDGKAGICHKGLTGKCNGKGQLICL